jgi:uncharacterized protein YecE (DUF72 family)
VYSEEPREDGAGRLLIGTSGWVYKHWLDIFYPRGLSGREQLVFYARHFDTVEINYSFYRLPGREVFEAWREESPEGFLFAVKGSRYLTHMKKLTDPQEPLERLMESAGGLSEKLGPILFQFPSQWKLNLPRLSEFVEALHAYGGQRFAFEFRHRSWLVPDVYALLQSINAALCLPVSPTVPLDPVLTGTWTYIRFHTGRHGVGFSEEELEAWAERLRPWLAGGVDAYVYFNNDPGGHALNDAKTLRQMLA